MTASGNKLLPDAKPFNLNGNYVENLAYRVAISQLMEAVR